MASCSDFTHVPDGRASGVQIGCDHEKPSARRVPFTNARDHIRCRIAGDGSSERRGITQGIPKKSQRPPRRGDIFQTVRCINLS